MGKSIGCPVFFITHGYDNTPRINANYVVVHAHEHFLTHDGACTQYKCRSSALRLQTSCTARWNNARRRVDYSTDPLNLHL